jgi:iron-sulfur cluster assembly protein
VAITVTDDSKQRASDFLTNRGHGLGLRLGVKTTGCSGLAYVLEFVDELNEDDTVIKHKYISKSRTACSFYA